MKQFRNELETPTSRRRNRSSKKRVASPSCEIAKGPTARRATMQLCRTVPKRMAEAFSDALGPSSKVFVGLGELAATIGNQEQLFA
jgi:hypothetical protein